MTREGTHVTRSSPTTGGFDTRWWLLAVAAAVLAPATGAVAQGTPDPRTIAAEPRPPRPAPSGHLVTKRISLANARLEHACEIAIAAQLPDPNAVEKRFGTTSIVRASSAGEVVVEFALEATRGAASDAPGRARCVFKGEALAEAVVTK